MTPAILERLIDQAMRAPSGDNCQPWRFVWDGRELTVFEIHERSKTDINRDGHASLLALGCLVESFVIAAADVGFETTCQFDFTSGGERAPWVRLAFRSSNGVRDPLSAALTRRYTDRRPFESGSLAPALRNRLQAEMARFPGCKLHWVDVASRPLVDLAVKTEDYVWRTRSAHAYLMRWMRFSRAAAETSRDGIPWWTWGVSFAKSRLLWPLRSFTMQRLANATGFLWIRRLEARRLLNRHAHLGLLTVSEPSPSALVDVGRATLRLWLVLDLEGYGFQPVTTASLSVYDAVVGVLPASMSDADRHLLVDGRRTLKEEFRLAPTDVPAWMFRTGRARLPRPEPTYRLRREHILTGN